MTTNIHKISNCNIIDFSLLPGVKVGGNAYYINSTGMKLNAQTEITFEDIGKVVTSSNEKGQFEVWLPNGTYQTTARIFTFEYNMSMNYSYIDRVEVSEDMTLSLNLSKLKEYGLELEWIEGVAATIGQNESVTYTMSINNTGNVEEIFHYLPQLSVPCPVRDRVIGHLHLHKLLFHQRSR